jgi:hypothetical protein
MRCPCASPPSKRIEGGGAALLVFNSCREEVPLSRSDHFPLRKKRLHILVLIHLVIFLLLLLPWLAALCGVEKKGEEAKEKTGGERKMLWSPSKICLIRFKFRFLLSN